MAAASERNLAATERQVADQIGALMEFWGFKRILGRIWCTLYLSPTPLSAAEIGKRLELSASAVSVTITELKRWGVVHEAMELPAVKGRRAQAWRAETDVWHMVTNVMRQRELPMVRRFEDALQDALDAAEDAPLTPRIKHVRAALKSLLQLAGLGRSLLTALLDTAKVNAEALRKFRP